MKLWIKLGGTALMACTAAVCAWAALGGITGQAPERENTAAAYSYVPSCSLAEAEYVLREYDGCVAVFAAGEKKPVTLTDIEVRSLRRADRELLSAGLPCAGREEVLALLEDLGS